MLSELQPRFAWHRPHYLFSGDAEGGGSKETGGLTTVWAERTVAQHIFHFHGSIIAGDGALEENMAAGWATFAKAWSPDFGFHGASSITATFRSYSVPDRHEIDSYTQTFTFPNEGTTHIFRASISVEGASRVQFFASQTSSIQTWHKVQQLVIQASGV